MSDETPAPIDLTEFAPGVAVSFHHMNGCEVCAKLQRLVMVHGEVLQQLKTAEEEMARREHTQKRSWQNERELQSTVGTRDELIDLLLEKLADKILEVRES